MDFLKTYAVEKRVSNESYDERAKHIRLQRELPQICFAVKFFAFVIGTLFMAKMFHFHINPPSDNSITFFVDATISLASAFFTVLMYDLYVMACNLDRLVEKYYERADFDTGLELIKGTIFVSAFFKDKFREMKKD